MTVMTLARIVLNSIVRRVIRYQIGAVPGAIEPISTTLPTNVWATLSNNGKNTPFWPLYKGFFFVYNKYNVGDAILPA